MKTNEELKESKKNEMSAGITELRCPACQLPQKMRLNEEGKAISSCIFCGWKDGKYETYAVRAIEARNGQETFEVVEKIRCK